MKLQQNSTTQQATTCLGMPHAAAFDRALRDALNSIPGYALRPQLPFAYSSESDREKTGRMIL